METNSTKQTEWGVEKYEEMKSNEESTASIEMSYLVICEVHVLKMDHVRTCYSSDSQIHCIGVRFVIMCLNVVLNF